MMMEKMFALFQYEHSTTKVAHMPDPRILEIRERLKALSDELRLYEGHSWPPTGDSNIRLTPFK